MKQTEMEIQNQATEIDRAKRVEKERVEKENREREQHEVDQAFKAGYELNEIPEEAKINEEAITAYGAGLDERERQVTLPDETINKQEQVELARLRDNQIKALNEAIYIREVVRRELSDANLHYRTAEAGEVYRGRVIGKSNSYVIQSSDTRPGEVVVHERGLISGSVSMNEHAEISYPAGRAGIARSRTQQQTQRQHQRQAGRDMERSR